MKIRTRLTLLLVAAASIIFGLSAFLMVQLLERNLYTTLDNSLTNRAHSLTLTLTEIEHGVLTRPIPLDHPLTLGGTRIVPLVQLISKDNRVVASFPTGITSPLLPASTVSLATHHDIYLNATPKGFSGEYRFLLEPSSIEANRTLVIGRPIGADAQTIGRLTEFLWMGWILIMLLAALAGNLISRKALAPIEHIRLQAEAVDAEAESITLDIPNTGDEVEALGKTMNALLVRLHKVFSEQRTFLSNAAHELRTPLGSLLLELELADQESRSKEELLGAIKGALTTTQAISKLNDNLFLLAVLDERGEYITQESVDLVDLAYQSVSIREDLAQKKNASIEVSGISSAVIKANPMQIMLAIGNLLDNAIRHSPPQGKVIVTIESVNEGFRISVSDQGEGFPPEFLPIAFDRFSRPDNARNRKDGGAGLGLAMVKAITEAHGGKTEIASGNGKATTVSIWLPGTK